MKISVSILASALALAGCVVPAEELAQVVVATQGGTGGPAVSPPAPTAPATPASTGKAGTVRQVSAGFAVDATASDAQIKRISSHIAAAKAEIGRRLGRSSASPDVTVCVTVACDKEQGFTTRGMSFADQWLHISSRAWNDRKTYVHEMVHIETHTPDLMLARLVNPVPVWFDEGLATVISGTAGADVKGEECHKLANLTLPTAPQAFGAFSRKHGYRNAYGAAGCELRKWLREGYRGTDVIPMMKAGTLPR